MDDLRMYLGFVMMVVGGIALTLMVVKACYDYLTAKPAGTGAEGIIELISKLDQRMIAAAVLIFLGFMLYDPVGFPGLLGGGSGS